MARKIFKHFELQGESEDFYDAIGDESPLPCVLIAGAVLEAAVSTLLSGYFVNGDTSKDSLEETGILGTFQDKIDIAYCLGLISKTVFQNLSKIGEIRNLFAHSHKRIDFTNAKVTELCEQLTLPRLVNFGTIETPTWATPPPLPEHLKGRMRQKFTLTATALLSVLIVAGQHVQQRKRPKNEW